MASDGKPDIPWAFVATTLLVALVMGAVGVVYAVRRKHGGVTEAAGLLANINASQASYRAEFGVYCDVDAPAPAAVPGPDPVRWDAAAVGDRWRQLGFRPDGAAVSYVVNTIAGRPGETAGLAAWEAAGVELPCARSEFVSDHWFLARARGDRDGDGIESLFWITHRTAQIEHVRAAE